MKKDAKIECCVFDFGGVMSPATDPYLVRPTVESLGLDWLDVLEGYRKYRSQMDADTITCFEMYSRIWSDAGVSVPEETTRQIVEADMESYTKRNEKTLSWMRELKYGGYKIGILTNMNTPFEKKHFKRVFGDYIALSDAMVVSGEERVCKPDPRIYETMAGRLGADPGSICFFDDVEENCAAARAAGWSALRFEGVEKTRAAFERLLREKDSETYVRSLCERARAAWSAMKRLPRESRDRALEAIAATLEKNRAAVFAANAEDADAAKKSGLSAAMTDRLLLDDARFESMVDGVRHVATLPDPCGETVWRREMPSGISIEKVREPFGVIAVVFESRPNVFIDTAALCLKAGNATILRGGKEAAKSNAALAECVRSALASCGFPEDAVLFVDRPGHETVASLVCAEGLVDLAIPRGGERLVRAVTAAARVPVLKHYKGVCHIYVDDKADLDMALAILDNAKTQRPGACNAAECLLVNRNVAADFMPMVRKWAEEKGVALHSGDAGVEYLSFDLNVAEVADVREAVEYINANSSRHSDAIITSDADRAAEFMRDVDSACVYHNASTRFTDGAQFGMGAEIGISTDKLHARGPMGLEELTTFKYKTTGGGAIRK